MDGRSRPYFCGVDQNLNFQQKEALAQGIQQVVETTPPDFEFFEFQFTGHRVYIYKLDHGIILLVLTGSNITYSEYTQAIQKLKRELQEDIANAIATFRLLAGNVSLSNQNYWKKTPKSQATETANLSPTILTPAPTSSLPQKVHPPTPPPTPASLGQNSSATTLSEASLKDFLTALNQVSQFTAQYLGNIVVSNNWRSSRPAVEWMNQFQISRSGEISLAGTTPPLQTQVLSAEQQKWMQDWTEAFVDRCSKVIRDFPELIKQRALNEAQRALLLPNKS